MIQLYTGDGKGKTTAAIGQCVRFAGSGQNVIFSQFMKGNDTSELNVLAKIENIEILRSQQNFGFFSSMSEEDKEKLTAIHNDILDKILNKLRENQVQMVIMDEITYPVKWGLLSADKLNLIIKEVKRQAEGNENRYPELIFTGRNPSEQMLEEADYISEIKAEKHPYERGIHARRGIEF